MIARVLFLFVLLACLPAAAEPPAINTRALGQGFAEKGVGEQGFIFRSQEELQEFWSEYAGDVPLPVVDFTRNDLAVYTMGTQPSGGYGVIIMQGQDTGDGSLAIQIRKCLPDKESINTAIMTTPVDAMPVPKTQGEPRWDVEETHCKGPY